MPFTIPSNDLAGVPARQSVWYDTDIAILVAGILGTGVLTGCAVSAQGSPDMTIAIEAGTIQASAGTAAVTVTSGNLNIGAADGAWPRIDLISVSASGTKTVTAGTAASAAKPPALPSGHTALAMIDVPANDTTISTGQITDKRVTPTSVGPLNKLDATAAPTVNDDSGDGYAVGSIWINVTADLPYICVDASSGAAVWNPFESAGGEAALGTNWCRWPWIVRIYGVGCTMNSPQYATDGTASASTSNSVNVPQSIVIDLGQIRPVGRLEVRYADSSHRSDDGTFDWSDNESDWTTAVSWTDDTSINRIHDFAEVSHRYWRIRTTQTGSPASTGVNVTEISLFPAGTEHARGLTPTSSKNYSTITNATDGLEWTVATCANAWGSNDWFRVDLGSPKSVQTCVVLFADSAHSIFRGLVQYSTDDSNWSDAIAFRIELSSTWRWLRFDPITARYWRIYCVELGHAAGVDFRLFGFWG